MTFAPGKRNMRYMSLSENSREFLDYLENWQQTLENVSWSDLCGDRPETVAVISVDLINGFCREGALRSPRIEDVIPAVVKTFTMAHAAGVRDFVLTEDSHPRDSPEFKAWPPHCIEGTSESESVEELKQLPFYDDILIIKKTALASQIGTSFEDWLGDHQQLKTFVVVGDCTDLCVYHTAMFLRMHANAHNDADTQVIVPANTTNTFDIPTQTALDQGIYPHPAELHHLVFLHHLAMNNVRVVQRIRA